MAKVTVKAKEIGFYGGQLRYVGDEFQTEEGERLRWAPPLEPEPVVAEEEPLHLEPEPVARQDHRGGRRRN